MNPMLQLLRPWTYLVIRGNQKSFFDWFAPVGLTIVSVLVILASDHRVNFYGVGGVVPAVTAFVQNLPGFFVAALAAVATFNRQDLDRLLPEPTPTIPIQARGIWVQVELTRRRFLSVLFSFLTAQSIAVTLLGICYQNVSQWLAAVIPSQWTTAIASIGMLMYFLFFWQLITVTCLGLYYLGDRIHHPEGT